MQSGAEEADNQPGGSTLTTPFDAALRLSVERLRETDARTEFAMRAARMGVWELRIDTREVYWSPSLEVIAGLEPGRGPRTIDELLSHIDPEDRSALERSVERAAEAPAQDFSTEFRLVRPDGERRWLEGHARFVPDGGARTLIGIGIDVTDRRTTEEKLQQARKMEAIGRLAGGIAHDFNNLLTAILGYSELLLERVQDDQALAADV
jgi:PAS domain S-box-containing protein